MPARGWEVADLVAADVLDAVPGDPPVPISVWRAHPPHDPPTTPSSIFDGLTPRLAAMLIATYTDPGQTIIDMTADLAVEGAAGAGGRVYRRVDRHLTEQQHQDLAQAASLILLRWPPPPDPDLSTSPVVVDSASPTRSDHQRSQAGSDPNEVLALCRDLLAEAAHTVVILMPPPAQAYRDHARVIIPAASRAGLGYLQHLVIVTTPIDDLLAGPAPNLVDDGPLACVHLDLLVLVLRRRPCPVSDKTSRCCPESR